MHSFFGVMAKQVGCYLVGAAGWWSTLPTKMEDCLGIKPAERKAELRRGERQIPKDTELLDPAIPKPSFPRTFQCLNQCLPLWFKLFSGGLLSQGCSSSSTVALCSHPCLALSPGAYPDACCAALEHSVRNSGPGWVYHGYESRKAQAAGWKVHGLHVKGVAMWVVLLTQVELAEA